jgi:hypothetical protein
MEGLLWLALEHLRSAPAGAPLPGLEGVGAVAADGFTDFTPTQLAILGLLARRLHRVVITLPHAGDERRRMWHWTDRTLNNIRHCFAQDLAEIDAGEWLAPPADPPCEGPADPQNGQQGDRARTAALPAALRGLWDSGG